MKRLALLVALAAAGCSGNEPAHQHATLGTLGYDMPDGWHRADQGARTSVWTPADNNRKESVTVIRAELDREIARRGPGAFAELLVAAQGSLPGAHVGAPEPLITKTGLRGFRVRVDFAPFGGEQPRYARVHAIVLDGDSIVHVMYTARTPDPDPSAFEMALDTAHEEG